MPSSKSPLLIALVLGGCLGEPPVAPDAPDETEPDAGPTAPVVRSFAVRDADGRVHPPEATPRRPLIVLEVSAPVVGEPEPAVVLRGLADDALEADLERPPLRSASEERIVDAVVERWGTSIAIAPSEALSPGEPYLVALGGWAADAAGQPLGDPFVVTLRVAEAGAAGAVATAAWPADGTSGVPTALPMLAVRFDADVDGLDGVRLETAGGREVPVRRQLVSCALVGWRDGVCVVLRPDTRLATHTEHRVVVGDAVTDRTGASVGPWEARFVTGAATATRPFEWLEHPCALDEEAARTTCVLADDRSLTIRVRADSPLRLWAITDHAADSAVAPRGEATLRLDGLAAGTPYEVALRAVDLSGREHEVTLALATEADLAPLSITEVRADPRGPEPQQEYVEVANVGRDPVDLGGFSLSDDAGREGDLVAHPFVLPAGARVLFVADAFDPSHPEDDLAPPGVGLIRVGTSLGSGGLKNAGEPLFLRDADGRRLSAAPALAATASGACIVRVGADPRSGDEAAFAADPAGGCTPGRPDRTP